MVMMLDVFEFRVRRVHAGHAGAQQLVERVSSVASLHLAG
jgi:hypothetical protein